MQTARPGQTREWTIYGAPEERQGLATFTMKDGQNEIVQGPTTDNIVEEAPGTYTVTYTAPAAPIGEQFTLIWDPENGDLAASDTLLIVFSTVGENDGYPTLDEILASSSLDALLTLSVSEQSQLRFMAIAVIENFTSQSFDSYQGTMSLDGTGTRRLVLPRRLESVDTVEVWGGSLREDGVMLNEAHDTMLVTPEAFPGNWYSQAIRDGQRPVFPIGIGTVEVTGLWGWGNCPERVILAMRLDMEEQALALANPLSETTRAFSKLSMSRLDEGPLSFALDRAQIGVSQQVAALLEPYVWHAAPQLV